MMRENLRENPREREHQEVAVLIISCIGGRESGGGEREDARECPGL